METKVVITDNPPPEVIDPFVNVVWCLIYNMIEAGDTGVTPTGERKWWAEEFSAVKRELIRRGFNLEENNELI